LETFVSGEPVRWDFFDLTASLGDALQQAEDALRLEQAVYGLDSMDEVRLQGVLAEALARRSTVAREVYYPSAPAKRKSARPRCDLVLTPFGRELRTSDEPDLFTPADACPPQEALWLEVKAAYQFRDVATRHDGYGGTWKTGVVDDLKKMSADPKIREAGLVLVVFNESEEVLAKDLQLFEDHLVTQGVVAGFRHVRSVRITERMGHRFASVAVWPTVQR
jgi:hypothetical protein